MADLEGVKHAEHEPLLLPLVVGVLERVLRTVPLPVVEALALFARVGGESHHLSFRHENKSRRTKPPKVRRLHARGSFAARLQA